MFARSAKGIALAIPYVRQMRGPLRRVCNHFSERGREVTKEPELVYFIDEAWCDLSGVFLRGWVHTGVHRVQAVSLVCGDARVTVTPFGYRPDVLPHYPYIPAEGAASFNAYLACAPFTPVLIEVESDGGIASAPVNLQAAAERDQADPNAPLQAFISAMKARKGVVLELGARIVGSMTEGWRKHLEPECRYLGNDIHPEPGIDVVGDVHNLSQHVTAGSLDGIFSVAVLEHLAEPWIAAAEINRALRSGGETLHVTHQSWPLHEMPNDFFRMSDAALRSLFGPRTGFEVLECGMSMPVSIVPPPRFRNRDWLNLPFGRGYGQSYVRARKVREVETVGQLRDDLVRISRAYPPPG